MQEEAFKIVEASGNQNNNRKCVCFIFVPNPKHSVHWGTSIALDPVYANTSIGLPSCV